MVPGLTWATAASAAAAARVAARAAASFDSRL
jgi:hypothetical protein